MVISGHASEVARFRQRAPVQLWVFWESAVKDHWDGIEAYLEFQGHPAHFGRIRFDPQNLADSLSSRSRPKASSSAPPVQRRGSSGGDSLGSSPLTQSSDAEPVGVARRLASPLPDAARTIAMMPARIASGSSGQAIATAPISPRSPQGFPWRTSPQTPPGIGAF